MASIFIIKNNKPNSDYDFFSEAVIVADTIEEALSIHPNKSDFFIDGQWTDNDYIPMETWNTPENLTITCVGTAGGNVQKGVLSACFKAG